MNITNPFGRKEQKPAANRMGFALRTIRPARKGVARSLEKIVRPREKCVGTDRLYFAVRSLGVQGRDHVLQYAFADDRGNVVMSAFAHSEAPAALLMGCPAEDLAMEPLDPEAFEYIAAKLCGGATLVAYQRVLQGGLLPYGAARSAASIECAWRRFQQVARSLGLPYSSREPLTLNDCLGLAGLPVPISEDAALRALAIRSLWRWMDEVE